MTSVHTLNQPVVLDLGSGLTKGGYAGTPDPSTIIGTLVGKPKLPKILPTTNSAPDIPGDDSDHYSRDSRVSVFGSSSGRTLVDGSGSVRGSGLKGTSSGSDLIVGEALHGLSGIVRLYHPLDRGIVRDWSGAEEVWRHVSLDILGCSHGEHPFLVTENALNPRGNRERLAEFFFESLHVPSLYVSVPGVLSLYASGRTTGVVLDVGDSVTTALPVAEGHCDLHGIRRLDIGGRDVTERFITLLRKCGAGLFASSSEQQAVRRLKERLGYVARDGGEEEKKFIAGGGVGTSFDLPDGNVVEVGAERFRGPEILFNPGMIGRETGGVQDCVAEAIEAVDIELKKRLYGSILLAGGSTKFRGFGQRLLGELRGLAPRETKVRIHAPPDRLYSAFTGGSILASLSTTFRSMAVSREEYFENGPAVIHRKTL